MEQKKDTSKRKARDEDFTFATPLVPSDTGLLVSTGRYSEEKAPRRSPRKRKAKSSLETDQAPFVRHIHVRTTEDLVRQASQEAAELEHLAFRRRKFEAMSKPKQPKGSFVFFLNEYRARMVKDASLERKKTNLVQMTRQAGILWKGMDDEMKKPYQDLAARDKERYLMEKKEYSLAEEIANAKIPEQSENQVETVGSSLRSYQNYLQDQINDLQNRLDMFQSRCSQPVQRSLSPVQSPHLTRPAAVQGDHLMYVDPLTGQQHIPRYTPMIPPPILHAPSGRHTKARQGSTAGGYEGKNDSLNAFDTI